MAGTREQEEMTRRYVMDALNATLAAQQALMRAQEHVSERFAEAERLRAAAEESLRLGQEDRALALIDDVESLASEIQPHSPDLAFFLNEQVLASREEMKVVENPPGERDWFKALIAGKGALTVITELQNRDLERKLGGEGTPGLGPRIERAVASLQAEAERQNLLPAGAPHPEPEPSSTLDESLPASRIKPVPYVQAEPTLRMG